MAQEMALALILLIGTLHVSHVASLPLGDQCYEDTDCSTVAAAVTNSYCARTYSSCPYGVCACSSGYAAVGLTCNAEVAFGVACTDDAECVKDVVVTAMTCDGGTNLCICGAGETYDTTYKICLAAGKFALGQSGCGGTDANCDTVANSECPTTTCSCLSGYISDTTAQTCTKPYAGQACTAGVGCQVRAQIGSDTSEQVPTCTSSTCSCATTETQITINSMKRCVTTAATRSNQGIACTHLNDCDTYLCTTCAGWDATYCVGNGAVLKTASGVLLATLLLVGSFFY